MSRIGRLISFVLLMIVGFFLSVNDSLAADKSTIMTKWNYTQYYYCSKNYFKKTVTPYAYADNVISDVLGSRNGDTGSVKMPSNGFQGSPSEAISCQTLIMDYDKIQNVSWNNSEAANSLMSDLGYETAAGDVIISYVRNDILKVGDSVYRTPHNETIIIQKTNDGGFTTKTQDEGGVTISSLKITKDGNRAKICYGNACVFANYSDNADEFAENINRSFTTISTNGGEVVNSNGASTVASVFKYPSNAFATASTTIRNRTGMSLPDLTYNNSELYTLYLHYLISNGKVGCGDGSNTGMKVKLKTTEGTFKECRVDFGDRGASSISVNTQTSTSYYGTRYPVITSTNMANVVSWFNNVDENTLTDIDDSLVPPDGVVEAPEETQEQGETDDPTSDECYNAGIDGISWIACPALTNLTYTANGFDGIIDGMLAIKSEYYDTNSDAHTVWEVMRNVANVAMILILLVIIVSQISGYGIDNYGIKKMLPKLVIVAIIMNFSFILCELIIDLSNIVGVGLRDIFGGIGQSIGNGAGKGIGEIVSVLLGIAGGAGAVAGSGIGAAIAAVGVVSGPMIILMIIMALLGVIVSLLIFFASLGIRLMLVIICVGVAPVAMVCYILPNTKKGFDAWWKAFKACLIIYPICGAMLGISELIKGIAWSPTGGDDPSGVAMKLVALIAPYLPFFLLPSLLKGAIGAVGNLSSIMNSIGDKIRGTAKSGADAVRNTEAFKDASNVVAMERQNRAANRVIKRLKDKTNLSDGEKRRLGRARATMIANRDKIRRDSSLADDTAFEAANIGLKKKAESEELANYMTLINHETKNGEDQNELFKLYDQYMLNDDQSGALAVARIAGRRKDTASKFMSEKFATTNKQQVDMNRAHSEVFDSVAKEIATGENAKNYRASDGVGFEYASQVNSGFTSDGPDFGKWSSSSDNIKNAAQHNITSRSELMGMKGSALNDLDRYVHGGTLQDDAEIRRIEDLASQAIANRNEAGADWDSTKAEQLARLSGKYIYDKNTNTFRERSRGNPSNFVAHGGGYR